MPIEIGHAGGGPEPILDETKLHLLHHRSCQLDMGVSPGPQFGMARHVFIADIVSSHIGRFSIDDDNLPMITEVELELVGFPLGGVKRRGEDSRCLHFPDVTRWQFVTADFIHTENRP